MSRPDDKSPGCVELAAALVLAKTERRASVSCALSVLHMAWKIGEWRTDNALRRMMVAVIGMNQDVGMETGMTDDEVALLRRMRSELEGGAA